MKKKIALIAILASLPLTAKAQNYTIGLPPIVSDSTLVVGADQAWPTIGGALIGTTTGNSKIDEISSGAATQLSGALQSASRGMTAVVGDFVHTVFMDANGGGGGDIWVYDHTNPPALVQITNTNSTDAYPTLVRGETVDDDAVIAVWEWSNGGLDGIQAYDRRFPLCNYQFDKQGAVTITRPSAWSWGAVFMRTEGNGNTNIGAVTTNGAGGNCALLQAKTAGTTERYPYMEEGRIAYHSNGHVYFRSLTENGAGPVFGAQNSVPEPTLPGGGAACQAHGSAVLGNTGVHGVADVVAYLGTGCFDPGSGLFNKTRLFVTSLNTGAIWQLPIDMGLVGTTESEPPQYHFEGVTLVVTVQGATKDVRVIELDGSFLD